MSNKISSEISSEFNLKLRLYDNADAFELLRDGWHELFQQTLSVPFLSWEWMTTWFEFFGKNRNLFILAVYREAELIAVLPLCLEKKRFLGLSLTKAMFVGAETGGAAYLDVLAKPADKTAAIELFQKFLATQREIDVFDWEGIAANSPLLQNAAQEFKKKSFRLNVAAHDVCQFLAIDADSTDEEALTAVFSARTLKKMRKLKQTPGFELRQISEPEKLPSAFERFARLHDEIWTGKGGSEITGHEYLLEFHRAAVAACAGSGMLFIEELWLEGQCAAAHYSFRQAGVYFYFSSSFDPAFAGYSPMMMLCNLSIENAISNGIRHFDFLRGGQEYKKNWATGENHLVTARLSRRNTAASVSGIAQRAEVSTRELITQMLPAEALQNLKNRYRRRRRRAFDTAVEKPMAENVFGGITGTFSGSLLRRIKNSVHPVQRNVHSLSRIVSRQQHLYREETLFPVLFQALNNPAVNVAMQELSYLEIL